MESGTYLLHLGGRKRLRREGLSSRRRYVLQRVAVVRLDAVAGGVTLTCRFLASAEGRGSVTRCGNPVKSAVHATSLAVGTRFTAESRSESPSACTSVRM